MSVIRTSVKGLGIACAALLAAAAFSPLGVQEKPSPVDSRFELAVPVSRHSQLSQTGFAERWGVSPETSSLVLNQHRGKLMSVAPTVLEPMREFFELGPPRPCPDWISDRFQERVARLGGVPPVSPGSLLNAQRILDGELPQVFYGGARNQKLIALTFDDGPRESTTQRLLEILDEYDAKATFYLQGTQVERFPGLTRKIAEQGHEIGNHTFFHSNLTTVSDEDLRNELIFANRVIEEAAGVVPATFRPPGGKKDERVIRASVDLGMVVAMWTINPIDYTRPSSSNISTLILNQARNGSVVLLHEGVEPTVEMLPGLLKALQYDGFRFVTVSELIEARMLAQKSSMPSSSRGGGKRRRG